MANHLTPTELAREAGLERREVIAKCMETGRPDLPGSHRQDPLPREHARGASWRQLRRPRRPDAQTTQLLRARRSRTRIALAGILSRRERWRPRTRRHDDGLQDDRRPAAPGRWPSTPIRSRSDTRSDGDWRDVTFAEVGEIVSRDRPRPDRPRASSRATASASCANTRPEWTYCDFAIASTGAVGRPDLPDELARGVRVGRSATPRPARSSARTRRRWPRSSRSASACPARAHRRHRSRRRRRRRDHARRRCASAAASATPPSSRRRSAAVSPDDAVHLHLHVGHDRAAEGLRPDRTATTARSWTMARQHRRGVRDDDVVVPVPAARPRVRAADPALHFDVGHASRTSAATRSRSCPS